MKTYGRYVQRTHLKQRNSDGLTIFKWTKVCREYINVKNKRSDIKRDKEEHCMMLKPIIHHEDIKLLIYNNHIHKEETITFARKI